MNREIKFRAWHFGLKRMFSAEEMAKDQMALLPTGYFANIHSDSTQLSRIYLHHEMLPLEFTGLTDKNGKEIYEGDIVKSGFHPVATREVKWIDWKAGFYPFDVDSNPKQYEVIGNIYENPELLKVETKN